MTDPFATAALRDAVLAAWAGSPTRFREDANAEEDLRLGGYAGTWFAELAQNAADAADAAGRLRVAVTDGELRVANSGTPLTADGVAALASLRASAKRDDAGAVGRFGVGFAAVLALSDAPRVVSTSGAVAFSAARTAEAVVALPGPAAELARRGEPPVLRLVWPSAEQPPAGYTTEVRLPLRPGVDPAALLREAAASAPDLLLALPALAEIDVDGAVLTRHEQDGELTINTASRGLSASVSLPPPASRGLSASVSRWRVVRRSGVLDAGDVAAEQRDRRTWSLTWALPLDGPLGPDVVHAPTPTVEAIGLPARLIATLPLEPDRRRVRPGPATDAVLDGAATAYVDLVRAAPPAQRLALVPEPGFPRSALDGALRERVLDALRAAAWLPGAGGGALVPAGAEWPDLPGAGERLPVLLAQAGGDRLAAPPYVPAALAELGVRRVPAAALAERLFGVERPVSWWAALYDELAGPADTVPGLVDELRGLPVPLADGRCAAGPAGVLLPSGDPGVAAVAALALPGLHIAALAHPLLDRLGAAEAGAALLRGHPALVEAVDRSVDDAEAGLDPQPLAEAVLALLGEHPEPVPALGGLALPDEHGDPRRADELLLPDAALRPLLAGDAPLGVLDAGCAARYPRAALVALGVLDGFATLAEDDPAGPDHDLDDEERWWDGLATPPARLLAVRDLDLVADDAWEPALALLGADRGTRAAVLDPNGYTAWWLARHARLGGHRPGFWRLPSAADLAPLYDPPPTPRESIPTGARVGTPAGHAGEYRLDLHSVSTRGVGGCDDALLAAVGVRAGLAVADTRDARDLLERLADPVRTPDALLTACAHAALAVAVAEGRVDPADLGPPERVRAMDGSVASADVAAVLDAPWPAAVLPAGELVIGGDPDALAELLDLPLASEVVAGDVEGAGRRTAWRSSGEVVVACQTLGIDVPDGDLLLHDELWVAVRRPVAGRFRVPVWIDAAGVRHAEDPVRALLGLLGEQRSCDRKQFSSC